MDLKEVVVDYENKIKKNVESNVCGEGKWVSSVALRE